ncbi:MAG: UDP-N-acetylmuramate--L-alanine ligase [Gemmatimonadales bacterium]|nr:UDP-N-acetylmuramate--L-alanine ligase [Gemmatimonadales bacterium]NIN50011.1 UDP-N-acetylmuramate--L-alanine ligase [Gemmatimonadales bacterium]NIP07475.1 UDP-N-acetylmuramate--L-alanine ligase [Gemmatimonadales bacterium]NIR03114.1 UDP-N-acetylmuramate--L-alanine ligase [Gemmatimonadales bacterium]NIS66826.1 UDP-N-acetylmuramate--L-alanine ligase [Gemmatimonadales bacterium]
MHLFAPEDPRPIHFMGIAGAGMSAVALVAMRRGVPVTGCDTHPHGAAELAQMGARISAGHDPSHVSGVRAVVYTAAVRGDHEELEAARAAGTPVVPRAEALGEVAAGGRLVAVAGTHGKTTTTAMVTDALVAAGDNPTALVGGRVASWEGNARLGDDRLFVVEADEYDRSLLALKPAVALVNNVEVDHLECYGSLEALEAAFAEFAGCAGRVIVGADDAGATRVGRAIDVPVWRAGLAQDADIRLSEVRREARASSALVSLPDGRVVDLALRIPGLHNLRNGAMAIGAVLALGADVEAAVAGLARFGGVGRRFEVLGTNRGVTVVDDYAHHPSEVAATLAAARQRFPSARVVVAFQPHLYSRTKAMGEAMGIALAMADLAVVTDVYPAREEPIPGVSGKIVAGAARRAGVEVEWVPDRDRLAARLEELVADGDVVLTLGAGDITEVGRDLLRRLAGAAA